MKLHFELINPVQNELSLLFARLPPGHGRRHQVADLVWHVQSLDTAAKTTTLLPAATKPHFYTREGCRFHLRCPSSSSSLSLALVTFVHLKVREGLKQFSVLCILEFSGKGCGQRVRRPDSQPLLFDQQKKLPFNTGIWYRVFGSCGPLKECKFVQLTKLQNALEPSFTAR